MAVCELSVYGLMGVYFLASMLALIISVAVYRHNFWGFLLTNVLVHILVLANMQWILAILINHLC